MSSNYFSPDCYRSNLTVSQVGNRFLCIPHRYTAPLFELAKSVLDQVPEPAQASREHPQPSATCCSAPFCTTYGLLAAQRACAVSMYIHITGVNHQPLEVRFAYQGGKQAIPHSLASPERVATMGVLPVPVVGRQVPPRRSGANYPEHGVDEQAVVLRRTARAAFATGQQRVENLQTRSDMSWRRCAGCGSVILVLTPPSNDLYSPHQSIALLFCLTTRPRPCRYRRCNASIA